MTAMTVVVILELFMMTYTLLTPGCTGSTSGATGPFTCACS